MPDNNSLIPPSEMRALVLDGVGFDHLQVRRVPTPRPGPNQLLARVDAAGICTSLIKLVEQGPAHSLVYGWDVTRWPLILGDEGAVTLVEVGEALRGQYRPGQRFAVQPAVDLAPINHRERYRDGARGVDKMAHGYTLPGHLAEYVLIPEETLAAGCLLPVTDPTSRTRTWPSASRSPALCRPRITMFIWFMRIRLPRGLRSKGCCPAVSSSSSARARWAGCMWTWR